MRIVKDLIGKEVLDSDVNNMGIVDDIEFDKGSNEILSLVLKRKGISNAIKASKSEDIVPFDLVKTIGDKIILKDTYDI
ncbi:MAG: PRC-barrel domain-containing protein [Methanobrevibacter sp.]